MWNWSNIANLLGSAVAIGASTFLSAVQGGASHEGAAGPAIVAFLGALLNHWREAPAVRR